MVAGRFDTHEVTNQSPALADVDLFALDRPLQDAVRHNGAAEDAKALSAFGQRWGTAEMLDLGRRAHENPHKLSDYDAHCVRQDGVELPQASHMFMAERFSPALH